jgi:prephenate dehydratase
MTFSIAYLGPVGTNSEVAGLAYQKGLNGPSELIPYHTIAQVLEAVNRGEAMIGVVPVENSIQGSVRMTLDAMWELEKLDIVHTLVLPIKHELITIATNLTDIKRVYSHPQALGQCQKWLSHHLSQSLVSSTNSTAEAVQMVKEDPTAAAIASYRAAEIYQVPVLASDIGDYGLNETRFWVVQVAPDHPLPPKLTNPYISLAFTTCNVPGSLVEPLQSLAQQGINLTRIESRPTKRSLGEYIFYVDLDHNAKPENIMLALQELKQSTTMVKIFGYYDLLTIDWGEK